MSYEDDTVGKIVWTNKVSNLFNWQFSFWPKAESNILKMLQEEKIKKKIRKMNFYTVDQKREKKYEMLRDTNGWGRR